MSQLKSMCLIGIVIFILFSIPFIYCTQASSTWSQTYVGSYANVLVGTSDGGYAMAGYAGNNSYLMKTDANGTLQWTKTYDGGNWEEAYALVQTSDGGYALAGSSGDKVGIYHSDFWLVKTDPSGNMEWNHAYGGPGIEKAGSVIQTDDGGYAVAGYTDSFGIGLKDFWLVKTDPNGNMEWNQTYGTAENYEQAYSLVKTFDGGFALAGTMNNLNDNSIWLVKVDPLGNMEWNQTFGGENGTGVGGPQALVATSDGGYALVGGKTSPITTSYGAVQDGLLIKTNARGDEEWNQTYGTPGDDGLSALVQATDGGYALVGARDLFGPTKGDVWLIKTDSRGNMLWNKTYGGYLTIMDNTIWIWVTVWFRHLMGDMQYWQKQSSLYPYHH